MKYLKQFAVIAGIAFLGEILHRLILLPIPAGIYGIVILFLCLCFHWISVDSVREVSGFLVEIMPVMFIPAAVGLMAFWDVLKGALVPYIVIIVLTTVLVFAVSGRVTQSVIRLTDKERRDHE